MPVTTASTVVYITPVVLKTFLKHSREQRKREKEGREAPQDDIFFDQAFHIVKAFIELGTKNTIESLQKFTNTHIPSPYWAAACPVTIPLTTCNEAADILIDWFGPEELKHVVGGERWWQVRGLDGVEGEWIAEREHIDKEDVTKGRRIPKVDEDILRMEKLESVMLYVHGGGYFWGSINTHRFQVLRYARKFQGRGFAVNYRKAPQYPWPCPIQDVIAAYLYLIRPPPGALHKAVSPNKIVFAGDSAGGGLCLTTLTVLRDMGLPMPAGAVLISPWVDLTHSFASVMHNTETDIIPPHGFLAKPSTLWPIQTTTEEGPRIAPSQSNPPPKPGHADVLKPTEGRVQIAEEGRDIPQNGHIVETQEEMQEKYPDKANPSPEDIQKAWNKSGKHAASPSPQRNITPDECSNIRPDDNKIDLEYWEPKPPKVLMENPNTVPLEIHSQIQQYALTEQLTHPLVSPILQGSLGNLPPLYILAGDGEVLRDEIIYLAHRAAHPSEYRVRKGVLEEGGRQAENAEKFTTPTKVHLQVFDGMCHVLTIFMFPTNARYAYRSIAEFVKHVTQNDAQLVERVPFPEFQWSPHEQDNQKVERTQPKSPSSSQADKERDEKLDAGGLFQQNEIAVVDTALSGDGSIDREQLADDNEITDETGPSDVSSFLMIRERVDIHAQVRVMEPKEAIPCLNIPPAQIGIIKEAPAMRWYRGQEEWDKVYRRAAIRVVRKRTKLEAKAKILLRHALEQGLVHDAFPQTLRPGMPVEKNSGLPVSEKSALGHIQKDRRWGPLDLRDERPPPSAIAGRRDTPEALALLKKCIYHTAPVTHRTVPRLKTLDAIRAAFDPHDDPNAPPKQSVSEQQVGRTPAAAMHGLRIWDKILTYLGRKSRAKAMNGIKSSVTTIHRVSGVGEKELRPDELVIV